MLIKSKYKPRNVILTSYPGGAIQVSCLMTGRTLTIIGESEYQEKEIERVDKQRDSFIKNHPTRIIT